MRNGTRVTDRYGFSGAVRQIYDDFSAISASCESMKGHEWLEQQAIPIPSECLAEQWASVNMEGGGSIWSPVSMLTVEPMPT